MRIIVTGGAGFIGTNLVRLLVAKGHHVLNIDKLTYAANPTALAELDDHPLHQFLQADVCNAAAMRTAFADFRPDTVVHLAAESHVDRSISSPVDFVQNNILATTTLLRTASEFHSNLQSAISPKHPIAHHQSPTKPVRFLHLSTDEVYGQLAPGDPPFTESTPLTPRSPYSASKAASDHLIHAWSTTYGLPAIIARSCNAFGPWQHPEKFIPTVILNALRGQPVPIYGSGENIRDWIHVSDLCQALLLILENGTPGATYNIGASHEMKNIDLARMLCQLLSSEIEDRRPKIKNHDDHSISNHPYPIAFNYIPDRPGHDHRYAIDATKLKTELGWRPTQDPHTALRDTVRWYVMHRYGSDHR